MCSVIRSRCPAKSAASSVWHNAAPDGFGLARPSNTTPVIVLRFEADNAAALSRIQDAFRYALRAVKPDALLPF